MKRTWHIHIEGQVQGVGFRPFVYKQAQQLNVKGWVNNTIDGVHCEFNAEEKTAQRFYQSLIDNAPALSDMTSSKLQKTSEAEFDEFRIIHSNLEGEANLLLTPDFAICSDCRDELFKSCDRRHGYPFITCTNCGPRYSIIEKLPYDRETTTMEKFEMCQRCQTEYDEPLDRRYYSQTNSCAACGISMSLYDAGQNKMTSNTEEIITRINELWNDGKIVALKGIGGYLLTCDATNKKVIEKLRERKKRPAKPFALMYPDMKTLEKDVVLKSEGKQMLGNAISPVYLAKVKETQTSSVQNPTSDILYLASEIYLQKIAPGLNKLGVMLPYTPLYALLLESFGKPIVATSGNITNSPIIYNDEIALDELVAIADYVLTNNREIMVPQDDSVVSYTQNHARKIIYRRSRGMAPTYINQKLELPEQTVLATGAMLKSTFTYLHQKNIFVSQYLGNLDHFDTEQNYRHTVAHFIQLFGDQPEVILADKHPDYFSTRFAKQLSDELEIPIKKYQHHKAHFAAVLGEHALLNTDESVLGVMWDGTGLGDDGNIWGGEFFMYENYAFNRCGHFDYFNFIAGDKMPKEPRISALAATHGIEGAADILKEKFSDLEWKNYHTLLQKPDSLKASSMGRLFDAVSSLLGLKDRASYEGEAAMLLEAEARKYVEKKGGTGFLNYLSGLEELSTTQLLQGVINDLEAGKDKAMIAAKFHYALVGTIEKIANQQNAAKIAFSGGVFQNALLVDMIIEKLGDSYHLYFQEKLSPNDESISFGQLMCYLTELRK